MKTNRNKGFTLVELVIVIAVIAILAAVLIPTFTNMIQKAKDSAYEQDRRNQQTVDTIEKIDNSQYMTWEDFEVALAKAFSTVSANNETAIKSAIAKAIEDAGLSVGGLNEDQIKSIIEKTLDGTLSKGQVEEIVNEAVSGQNLTEAQIKAIVDDAVKGKSFGISKEDVKKAVNDAIANTNVDSIIEQFNPVDEETLQAIVDRVIAAIEHPMARAYKLTTPLKSTSSDLIMAIPFLLNVTLSSEDEAKLEGKSLTAGASFRYLAPDPVTEIDEEYYNWYADFEVSFSNAIEDNTIVLLGERPDWGDVTIPLLLPATPQNGGDTYYMLADFLSMGITYREICQPGFVFNCGALNLSADSIDTVMSVKLCLYENSDYTDPSYQGERIVVDIKTWKIRVPNDENLATAAVVMEIINGG